MDTSLIPGFITRKQAALSCKRAERTLQRYWSKAIELKDPQVLDNLKLWTEDGEITEGPDVSKQLIEELKRNRQNPTWYVRAQWVEQTYGPRLDDSATNATDADPPATVDTGPKSLPSPGTEIVSLLKDHITKLEQDKGDLRDELKIKNQQIEQASERDRETHVLMRDLHELLRDMQRRLPAPSTAESSQLTVDHAPANSPSAAAKEVEVVVKEPPSKSEKGSRRSAKKSSNARSKRKRQSAKATKARGRKKRPASVFAKHTPTLHRTLSGIFHRRK